MESQIQTVPDSTTSTKDFENNTERFVKNFFWNRFSPYLWVYLGLLFFSIPLKFRCYNLQSSL